MTRVLLGFAGLFAVLLLVIRLLYGGGKHYPDLTTRALFPQQSLQKVLDYDEPIGNVAVAGNGDIYFTVHPQSAPLGNKLLRYRDGIVAPFPNGAIQSSFRSILGIRLDQQARLWVIDSANHGAGEVTLHAFASSSGEHLQQHVFDNPVAPLGSFVQDFAVSSDGEWVYLADAGFWSRKPAVIAYEVASGTARRLLESHPALSAENYLIRTATREMRFYAGLISLKVGVDGITLSPDDQWLYLAAMNHDGLYRIRTNLLQDQSMSEQALSDGVERFADKPLSDGLSHDDEGNIYITDVEHGAIMRVGEDRRLRTLVRSQQIRWADGLSFGADGYLYIADSALPDYMLGNQEDVQAGAPYSIYRFRATTQSTPGQ